MLVQSHDSALNGTTAVGGIVGVKALQEQLRRIAFEAQKPGLDPAQYDGVVTLSTIIALANTAPLVGKTIHPIVGDALRVVDLIKAPIKLIPYGDAVIELVLSPWIIDEIYGAILGILRIVPGGGGVASGIDKAVSATKTALGTAAAPIAAALALFHPKTTSGLGAITNIQTFAPLTTSATAVANIDTAKICVNPPPGFTWVTATATVPAHWERLRVGQTQGNPQPGNTCPTNEVRDHRGATQLAPPFPGLPGVVRDHREWPKGKEIVSLDWSRTRTYDGHAIRTNLAARDLQAWEARKNLQHPFRPDLSVRNGVIAFLIFAGADNTRMGAFWDERTGDFKIKPVPEPSSSKMPWDYAADAVNAAVDFVEDLAQDAWNFIAENADDVYNAVKKYGCAIVNNDIVVAVAAGGAGIVASPAASVAIATGAGAGKAACAALEIAEALYAIYQLLSMDFPKPVPLTTPTPPPPQSFTVVRNVKVLLPLTPPVVPLAKSRYPEGTIAAFDEDLQRFRIAIPAGTQVPTQLGSAAATHFEVALTETAPPQIPVVPLTPFQKQTGTLPLHKNPLFWGALGIGAVAASAGGYAVYRRRRRLTT